MLGPNVGLDDWQALVKANWLCDELGLDTISAGATISWAMECQAKGLLDASLTDGLDLSWGSAEAIWTLLERIGHRDGWLGNLLAEGSKRAAEELGQGSIAWAIQHKGMEQSAYETHSATAMLLSYMTCDIGGHHGRAWAIWNDISMGRDKVSPEKVDKVIELQHIRPLFDCLGCCRFLWVELRLSFDQYVAALQAVTGVKRSYEDLMHISERAWNLTRLYWMREIPEFGAAFDAPPPRFVSEPATYGPTAGVFTPRASMEIMLADYYQKRGWDANGLPTHQTLDRLGLLELSPWR
jgi:aldehyde:ferredoxin oxidoreductase